METATKSKESDYIVETVDYKGTTIEVALDGYAENPRAWDNLSTMVCFHGRYTLGDKHAYRSDDYSGWGELERKIIAEHKPSVIRPLYLYDHSGLTIATTEFSCRWDSGQVGFVFVRPDRIRECFSCKRVSLKLRERACRNMLSEVETYDKYLRGEVYSYTVWGESRGNFYSIEEAIEQAKAAIDG